MTRTESNDGENPDSTDSDTSTPDGRDTETETPEADFDVELVPTWSMRSSGLTVADGDFFLRSSFNRIRRVQSNGDTVFETEIGEDYLITLGIDYGNALHADESGVYAGASAGSDIDAGSRLHAFDPETGEERWTYEEPNDGLHDSIRAVTVTDGVVIYASQSSGSGSDQEPIVRGLDTESGEEQWQIQLSEGFVNDIVARGDRIFVKQTFDLLIYQRSTQELLDERRARSGFASLATADDTLFVPGRTIRAVVLPTGDERWSVETEREVNTGIGVGDEGVFIGTEAGYVLGYDRDTGEELWERRVEGVVDNPPVVENGLVWIASERGDLTAFDETTGEQVYHEEVVSGFEFAVQNGVLKDDERDTAYEIRRS